MAGPRFFRRVCAVSLSCLRGFRQETWKPGCAGLPNPPHMSARQAARWKRAASPARRGRPSSDQSVGKGTGHADFIRRFPPPPERVLKSLSPASSAWGSRAQAYGKCGCQKTSFSPIHAGSSSTLRRTWVIASRSRTVTVPSSTVSKSTVTQKGVPISSWRR